MSGGVHLCREHGKILGFAQFDPMVFGLPVPDGEVDLVEDLPKGVSYQGASGLRVALDCSSGKVLESVDLHSLTLFL